MPMFLIYSVLAIVGIVVLIPLLMYMIGIRYIPHSQIGIIEKLWSPSGSLKGGGIISIDGKAGYQAAVLRGGLHFGYFPWQYSIHKQPLVQISEGRIGYVYARDGSALTPVQTLGMHIKCNAYQDSVAFLTGGGQRGRQRAILREGVYAINLALFVVIAEDRVYTGPVSDKEVAKCTEWQTLLRKMDGFKPVVVGTRRVETDASTNQKDQAESSTTVQIVDQIGIVTVHDGPTLEAGEIIAPDVHATDSKLGHSYFQDPEAFLDLGGRRGKQLQVLTDGTFFINRWFATVELKSKTLIPIGYVGVVVSYCGQTGADTTGEGFRYGEQVESGQRGVWKSALTPGKYALNPYAMKIELVPTVNFVLRWITGEGEDHGYDRELTSIDLITADGYEPVLPLSLVVHIDYEKAPSVIQRFGDVKRLISQTLDPILASYFRDIAQSSHMLDLMMKRDDIQKRATAELGKRFEEYDINCVAVLIGRPSSKAKAGQDDAIERLLDQLRTRRLAEEQVATFSKQQEAAVRQRELNDAKAGAEKQMELTQTKINVEIAHNRGEAQLAEARELAKREVAMAEAEKSKKILMAEADSRSKQLNAEGESRAKELMGQGEARAKELVGKAEALRVASLGIAEATGLYQKLKAYGDPRIYAMQQIGENFSKSAQPLVPDRVIVMGGNGGGNGQQTGEGGNTQIPSALNLLFTLMMAEKFANNNTNDRTGMEELERYAAEVTKAVAEQKKE
ncbi:MAG: SPFH domain-containing protein [Planctomycetota bacterium]